MIRPRLGVNIDHVATIRNARGENYPDPLRAALTAQKSGADSITIHLREDRRHIKDYDLKKIKRKIKIPLNLEMAPTKEMLKIAIKYKPDFACLVPEKRREITTEGGLNVKKDKKLLKEIIQKLRKNNMLFTLQRFRYLKIDFLWHWHSWLYHPFEHSEANLDLFSTQYLHLVLFKL